MGRVRDTRIIDYWPTQPGVRGVWAPSRAQGVGPRPAFEWQPRLAVGHQYTRIDAAAFGDSKTSDNAAVILSPPADADLSSRVDLIFAYQVQVIARDTDRTNHHAEVTLEVELFSPVELDLSFVWDCIDDPETEESGDTPDSNDFRMSAGLAIEY